MNSLRYSFLKICKTSSKGGVLLATGIKSFHSFIKHLQCFKLHLCKSIEKKSKPDQFLIVLRKTADRFTGL